MSDHSDFYAVSAQVIPVLFIALAFESRYFDRQPSSYVGMAGNGPRGWNLSQAVGRIAVVLMLALAEVAALFGLYLGMSQLIDALVIVGLVLGLLLVVSPFVARQWQYLAMGVRAGEASQRKSLDDGSRSKPEIEAAVKRGRRQDLTIPITVAVALVLIFAYTVNVLVHLLPT